MKSLWNFGSSSVLSWRLFVSQESYRSLCSKYHPDKWAGDKDIAHKRVVEINAAYDTLGGDVKRKNYDEGLRNLGKYDDPGEIDGINPDQEVRIAIGRNKSVIPLRVSSDPHGFLSKYQGIQTKGSDASAIARHL
jgi:curved DNA-binding protein CbpA